MNIVVNGFGGNGTGWTINHSGSFTPTVTNNVVQITNTNTGEANSLWYNTPENVSGNWEANFVYTNETGGVNNADGTAFVLQDESLTALGGGGNELGYEGITPSVALLINIYGTSPTPGYNVDSDGNLPASYSEGSVNNAGTIPINITLEYVAATTTLMLTAVQATSAGATTYYTYTASYTENIPSILGSNTAYVGFVGATGGLDANQSVGSFTFGGIPPAYTTANSASLTYGTTTLSGTDTINVSNNTYGPGNLTLGPLNDGGASAALNLNTGNTINLNGPSSLAAGSTINFTGLSLASNNAFGQAAVNIAAGGTLTGAGSAGVLTDSGILDPGAAGAPGSFNVTGLTLGTAYDVVMNTSTPGTGYTQIVSTGVVNLNNAALNITVGPTLPAGAAYTLIQSNQPITGNFSNYASGTEFTIGNQSFTIDYSGDNVVVTAVAFYVDSSWSNYASGATVPNPNPLSPGNPASAIFGTNAFSSIGAALTAAIGLTGQTIVVNAGTYPEQADITTEVNLIFQQGPISINSIEDVSGTGTTISINGIALTVGGDNSSTSLSSVIEGTGSLIKTGTGALTLLGSETQTGGIIVAEGTLVLGATNTIPANDTVTVDNGGTLTLGSYSAFATGAGVAVASGGLFNLGEYSASLSSLTGTGTVEAGASYDALTLTGTSAFAGVLTDGSMGGTLSLVVNTSGTVTLGGTTSSTFTGGTSISSGTLLVVADGALGVSGSEDGNVTLSSGTTLAFGQASISFDGYVYGTGTLSVPSGTLTLASTASVSVGPVAVSGTLDLTGGSLSASSMTIGSTTAALSEFNQSGGYFTDIGLVVAGPVGDGEWNITGGSASALGVGAAPSTGSTGNLDLAGTGTLTLGAAGIFGGSGAGTATFGGGTLTASANLADSLPTSLTASTNSTINPLSYSVSVTGLVSGFGALTESGSGTLILTHSNSYSGGTIIDSGLLTAPTATSMGTGIVTQAGGTLTISAANGATPPVINNYPNNVVVPSGAIAATIVNETGSSSPSMGTLSLGSSSTLDVTVQPIAGSVTGFGGSGTGWTPNYTGSYSPAVSNNVATMTTDTNGEATSLWYNTQVNTSGNWSTTYTYTDLGDAGLDIPADGVVFVLQSSSAGLNALGVGGGDLGYAQGNVTNSFAFGINCFEYSATGGNYGNFGFSYSTGGNKFPGTWPTGTVDTDDSVPIVVTLSYSLATQTLTVNAVQSGVGTYSTTYSLNIPALVGNRAYLGFTGGTGGDASLQTISAFTFTAPSTSVPHSAWHMAIHR